MYTVLWQRFGPHTAILCALCGSHRHWCVRCPRQCYKPWRSCSAHITRGGHVPGALQPCLTGHMQTLHCRGLKNSGLIQCELYVQVTCRILNLQMLIAYTRCVWKGERRAQDLFQIVKFREKETICSCEFSKKERRYIFANESFWIRIFARMFEWTPRTILGQLRWSNSGALGGKALPLESIIFVGLSSITYSHL